MKTWVGLIAFAVLVIAPCETVGAQSNALRRLSGETRSETFKAVKGGLVSVSSNSGEVVFTVWSRSEVGVTVEGVSHDDVDAVQLSQSGGTIRIDFYPVGSRRSKSVRFRIDLPADYNVEIKTGSGDVDVVGDLRGDVRVHTANGDLTLDDVGGKVDLSTSGGDIRTGILGDVAYLKTSGGDIHVDDADSELQVQTSGGDIKIGNVGKWLDANTSGGNVTVGNVGGEARLTTAGGNIEVGRVQGGARMNTAGGLIRLGSASGVVTAHTAGGDLELYGITGSVDARTAGGDILAEISPRNTGKSSLVTAGGDIRLIIDPRAKATIEARIQTERTAVKWRSDRNKTKYKSAVREFDIRSTFKPVQYEVDEGRGEIRATYLINGGGDRIWLETAFGSIEIRELTPGK